MHAMNIIVVILNRLDKLLDAFSLHRSSLAAKLLLIWYIEPRTHCLLSRLERRRLR